MRSPLFTLPRMPHAAAHTTPARRDTSHRRLPKASRHTQKDHKAYSMRKAELYRRVTEYFQQAMPHVQTELHYQDPFSLLVAVILSAQCTDKRVNTVTPALLHDYPNAEAMSLATPEVIY